MSAPAGSQAVSWRSMLEARPVRNAAAAAAEEGDGAVSVTVKRRKPAALLPPLSWLIRPKLTRTFRLDKLGTLVWRLCDGERTVEDVVDAFAERLGLTFHEARVAVTAYLSTLVQRGAMAMAMKDEEATRGAEQP